MKQEAGHKEPAKGRNAPQTRMALEGPQGVAAEDFVAIEAEVEWRVGPTGQGEMQEAEKTQTGLLRRSIEVVSYSRFAESHTRGSQLGGSGVPGWGWLPVGNEHPQFLTNTAQASCCSPATREFLSGEQHTFPILILSPFPSPASWLACL